ncbi:chloride channel protein, partial [Salmonella enterica]|uniref:chloride channel protein n=1 Tax=Salmonella enterica TaxID=28901 RepID=UPI0032B489ED
VIGCALILAFLACCIDESTLGSGKELMTNLLFTKNKYTHWYTSIVRIIGPIVTFCSGGAGGVFAPALSAGACIGSFFSHVF